MNIAEAGELVSGVLTVIQLASQYYMTFPEIAERVALAESENRKFGSPEDYAFFREKRKAAIAKMDADLQARRDRENPP